MNKRYFVLAFLVLLYGCEQSFQPKGLELTQIEPKTVAFFNEQDMPASLSDWGLFYIAQGKLNLRSDSIPYHLNTPLFSDYAHKFRSIWLPKNTQIEVLDNGELKFPVGSIISKTFYYPRESFSKNQLIAKQEDKAHSEGFSIDIKQNQMLETRLLVKHKNGWQALPYVWNKEQTNATLEITGASQNIQLKGNTTQDFTYIVPDANQCKGCHVTNHSTGELKPIGPQLKHLNLDYSYTPELTENQLKHLFQLGKITKLPDDIVTNIDWRNRNKDIVQAARSYLDINCAHCHNPDGPADTSALYLNKENLEKAHLGICKTPVAAGKGTGDRPFDITPGSAKDSILTYRMESNDPSVAMPELGRSIIHEEGVTLIKQWIEQMQGKCEIPSA